MDLTLIIILSLLAIVLLVVLVLFIISKLKGKVDLMLDKVTFSPGETMTGKITLKLRNPLQAKALVVGLRATRTVRSGKSTTTKTLFDLPKTISGEQLYAQGETSYDLKYEIPQNVLNNAGVKTGNETIDTMMTAVSSFTQGVIHWEVYTYLDIAGFDLKKTVTVNIS